MLSHCRNHHNLQSVARFFSTHTRCRRNFPSFHEILRCASQGGVRHSAWVFPYAGCRGRICRTICGSTLSITVSIGASPTGIRRPRVGLSNTRPKGRCRFS